ncbi:decaprenyl-phosphate phosphoribosyltransferase [soil metagenome]
MPPLIRALRPQEWIKNLLVFAGVVFSRQFDDGSALADAALTFAAFCAISSAGYLFNDLRDREHDRAHPEKRNRPIASGALSPTTASIAAVALLVLGIAIGSAIKLEIGAMVAGYGVITATYSIVLKRLVIIDVMTIASLFILRVVAGAVAVDARASEYLLVVTAMLALFLGFTKRRQEAILEQLPEPSANPVDPGREAEESTGISSRPVLEHYSLAFLDQLVAMVTAIAILSYIIYTVNSPIAGSNMLATAPSMLYGVFRYLYLIYDRGDTRSTAAILLEDPGMIFAGVTYLASAFLVLYAFS